MRESGFEPLPSNTEGREIDLVHYLLIIRKRAILISVFALVGLLGALGASMLMEDRFQAKAVISPVKEGGAPAGLSMLVQQLDVVPGMSLSSPSSASEILALLNSNMLRKKTIETHGLLPVIFRDRWDAEKKAWSNGREPTVNDALRAIEKALSVRHSPKDNTITMTFESKNPVDAANILDRFISVLNTHLSGESRRVADSNRRYLENQLRYTSDPLIRQNIYALIAQQIESSMMAGVMENFAFKIIDPPQAPDRKISPRRNIITIGGFLGALCAGILTSFVLEFFAARKARRQRSLSSDAITFLERE